MAKIDEPRGSHEDLTASAIAKAKGGLTLQTGGGQPSSTQTGSASSSTSHVNDPATGGPGGTQPPSHGGNGGGRGNNGPQEDNEPLFRKKELRIIMYFLIFLAALGAYVWVNGVILNQQKNSSATHSVIKNTKTPTPIQTQRSEAASSGTRNDSKTILYASEFGCATDEDRENGYANAQIHQVTKGVSLHVGPGCILFEVDAEVTRLDASGVYQFAVERQGGFEVRGTMDGSNDSVERSVKFLNDNKGKKIRLAIRESSYVHIN